MRIESYCHVHKSGMQFSEQHSGDLGGENGLGIYLAFTLAAVQLRLGLQDHALGPPRRF